MFIGGVVYFNTSFIFQVAIKYLAFFSISKGVWSIFSSFALGYYFDWMGAVDLIAGISLILINFNVTQLSRGIRKIFLRTR